MFIGIELKDAPEKFVDKALAHGIITNLTASRVVRLAPPINIRREDWDRGLDLLVQTIAEL